jgi:RNA polymerase sigma factor (sigma-70 family)
VTRKEINPGSAAGAECDTGRNRLTGYLKTGFCWIVPPGTEQNGGSRVTMPLLRESYLMGEFTPDPATVERWLGLCPEAQTGNEAAMAQLLGEVRPLLKEFAQNDLRGRTLGPWDASDVAQACCAKLLLTGAPLRGTTGPQLVSWLRTIVRNELCSILRDGSAQKRGGGQATGPLPEDSSAGEVLAADTSTPSQQAIRQEDHDRLEAALGRLSADHQQVIRLRLAPDDLTWAEIGQQMNRTEDGIKKLFARASQQLTKELKGQP